ncbi:MAG TPA: glutathione S-transferase [Burkholderiales bacterium]|nr:glutathione S-transferase [Burkholderiales bacterium]
MLKIWGRVNSINVQKVMWAVAELKIPHERLDAGMQFGVVNTPEYRKMNPNGRVPTIDYDGFVLWESNVVVRYLYAKHGPRRTLEQGYAAEKWMDWTTSTAAAPITTIFWQLIRTPPEKRDVAAVELALKQAGDIFKVADDALASQPYLSGGDFGMGDIPFGAFANRWYQLPIERPAHANLGRYYERLKARPAYRQHVMIPLT